MKSYDNLFFYPTITDEMKDNAGCDCGDYEFNYYIEGNYRKLKAKGKTLLKLEDSLETWKIESDGLHIARRITVEYPATFKGADGIACEDADLGICIVWTNRKLTQMGYILPAGVSKVGAAEIYIFDYEFPAGEIQGDLTLDTVVYIKKATELVRADETHLMNEAGVTVGTIDSVSLNFDNAYMDFPIKDIDDSKQPLWWLEMKQWEDPRRDPFNEDYVCLYLNSAYPYCPKVGDTIKNVELLVEIISTAYMMIIEKIDDFGYLSDTFNDVNLEPNSISKVIYYFYKMCDVPLKTESIDSLQKTIRQNIEIMLKGEDEQ